MNIPTKIATTAALAGLTLGLASCKRAETAGTVINVNGSDTMLQVGLGWQAAYQAAHDDVKVAMNGEGSGVGIKSLINGEIELAHSSRPMKDSEMAQIKEKYGKDPVEHILGYDGIAVFCNKENPIKSLSMTQLKEIFAEGGTISNWNQIDPSFEGVISLSGRSNTSGTHVFFKEAVCGKGVEYKKGISSMPGSAAVVDYCKTTKEALGYSGMGYIVPEVGVMKISTEDGGEAYEPTVANVQSKKYPIARALYAYTIGEPEGALKAYLDWVKGPEGQKIVADEKFVPLD